jgi:hypothetical protein
VTEWQTRERANDQLTFKVVLEGPQGPLAGIVEVSIKEGSGWKINRFTAWKHEMASLSNSSTATPGR